MNLSARDAYLENQILTAAPQQLRLMLIEGAIRCARQTLQHWDKAENELAAQSLTRARSIVGELMSAITSDGSELTRRVAGLYLFLFQVLARAGADRDAKRVRETIEVLEYERETWRLICAQRTQQADELAGCPAGAGGSHRGPNATGFEGTREGGLVLEA